MVTAKGGSGIKIYNGGWNVANYIEMLVEAGFWATRSYVKSQVQDVRRLLGLVDITTSLNIS